MRDINPVDKQRGTISNAMQLSLHLRDNKQRQGKRFLFEEPTMKRQNLE